MLRLHGARFALAATSVAAHRSSAAAGTAPVPLRSLARIAAAASPVHASLTAARRLFGSSPSSTLLSQRMGSSCAAAAATYPLPHTRRATVTTATSTGFLRGSRLGGCALPSSTAVAFAQQLRAFRVKGQEKASAEQGDAKQQQQQQQSGEEPKKEEEQQEENKDEKAKAEGEKAEEEDAKTGKAKKKKKPAAPKKSFMDHVRGLREDYAKFPDIYNSANAINFVVFTVFCLCSTGSNTEEEWWMKQWGLDNSFRPWTWFLHSFLTNNFLSMTYAMMLLHTMCHHVLPTLGSRGLMLYCGSTAVISGAIMWLGNYLYYGSGAAPEKQFGPWDIVGALFVMEYFYYGLTPFTILSSFSGWIKYAVWVGEVCILYFDWQPTVVGTLVGLALCRGVPRFKAMKPAAAAGAK